MAKGLWKSFRRRFPKRLSARRDRQIAELSSAAARGNVAAIATIIADGTPVDTRLEGDHTALLLASLNGHVDAIRWLIGAGANLHVRTDDGSTCLHWASANGTSEALEVLLAAGANPDAKEENGQPPAYYTTLFDRDDLLRFWLGIAPTLLDLQDKQGRTLLFIASATGKVKCVSELLRRGAALELRNREGETPLLATLSHGQRVAAELLIAAGADVQARGSDGSTALHHAAWGGLLGVSRRLLAQGLDANATDARGRTALHAAARRGFPRIRQLLIDNGADDTTCTVEGKSVADLRAEGEPLRQLTDELALFDQLPEQIAYGDAVEYIKTCENLEMVKTFGDERQIRALRGKARVLLSELVAQYRSDPARHAGEQKVSVRELTAKARELHPGEDDR